MGIARREARESRHWLRLIRKTSLIKDLEDQKVIESQIRESTEIMLILSSIINKNKVKK